MIPSWRQAFNKQFQAANYRAMLTDLDKRSGTHVSFRVAETPCFLPKSLLDEMADAGAALTYQLLENSDYMAASLAAIPAEYRLNSKSAHPHFMTADFGLVLDQEGAFRPRLVELQAFPSVYAFQSLIGEAYKEHFGLDAKLNSYLGGHTEESFWKLFREVVVGDHDPAEVVLAEIQPERQKTLPDFLLTSRRLGIPIVDISRVEVTRSTGKTRLSYREDGKLRPIRRIYNRVIVDELIQKRIELPFDYREDLDVEWAGHPNWYFQVSKFSIPHLQHETVPAAVFLHDWFAGKGRERLPAERENWVFKPLYSFAGKGIQFAPSDSDLAAIPEGERYLYLLQERVKFEPVIRTPEGMTQAEIRIMYVWPDDGKMTPAINLVRMGRGLMMGVDHNREKTWVGGSAGLTPTT